MVKTKKSFAAVFVVLVCGLLSAQNITTAGAYFRTVSDFYGTLRAYEADFEIHIGKSAMEGHLSFKAPDLLRMDFSKPEEQVICYSSDLLTIYLPGSSAVLQQHVTSDSSGTSFATPQGLNLMSRYYTVAYEKGQSPEMLDGESDELVYKLILYKKNVSEAFRYIKLAISADTKLIRRIEAAPNTGSTIIFDFFDYKLNPDISDQRFIYDAPSSANNYNNFLFSE